MTFGSNTTWNYVRTLLTDPHNQEACDGLYRALRKDTLSVLSRDALSFHDKEDILQEVYADLYEGWQAHAQKLENATAPQRNAYLKVMIRRICCDHLRRNGKHKVAISYDAEDFPLEHCGTTEDVATCIQDRTELLDALHLVCQLDLPPEQIIAFLMTRLSAYKSCCLNGKPAQVAQQLQGLTLLTATYRTITQLCEVYPSAADSRIYAPLMDKLKQRQGGVLQAARRFDMDSRAISVACCRITKLLRQQRQDVPIL